MSKTVVIVSENGKLINVLGVDKESDARYSKFAKRLLGDNGSEAVIDYGWSGKNKLKITGTSGQGEKIVLDAEDVVISGNLKIGETSLNELINSVVDVEISGIVGKEGEISVVKSSNASDDSFTPRYTYTISLDEEMLERITTLEDTVDELIRFEEAYKIGDGLEKYDVGANAIKVRLGTGLKFETSSESSATAAVALDYDTVPTAGSNKPVTSGGIYDAIKKGSSSRYAISVDASSGNMILLENATATEGE